MSIGARASAVLGVMLAGLLPLVAPAQAPTVPAPSAQTSGGPFAPKYGTTTIKDLQGKLTLPHIKPALTQVTPGWMFGIISFSGPPRSLYDSRLLRWSSVERELGMTPAQTTQALNIGSRALIAGLAAPGLTTMDTYSRNPIPAPPSSVITSPLEGKEAPRISRRRPPSAPRNRPGPKWYDADGNEYADDEIEIRRDPGEMPVAIYRGRPEDRPGVGQENPERTSHSVGGDWNEFIGNETYRTFAERVYREEERAASEILTPVQVARWKQLCLQVAGAAALRNPGFADRIGLTSTQRDAIEAIYAQARVDFEKALGDLPYFAKAPRLTDEQSEEVKELQWLACEAINQKVETVLTPEQRSCRRLLAGRPLSLIEEVDAPSLYTAPAGPVGDLIR